MYNVMCVFAVCMCRHLRWSARGRNTMFWLSLSLSQWGFDDYLQEETSFPCYADLVTALLSVYLDLFVIAHRYSGREGGGVCVCACACVRVCSCIYV